MKKIESHSQRVRVGMSAMLYRLHSVTPAPRFLDQPLYMLQLHAFPGTCPYQRDPLGGGGGGTEGPGQGWGWGVLMKAVMYGHHIYRPLNLPGPESNTFSQ